MSFDSEMTEWVSRNFDLTDAMSEAVEVAADVYARWRQQCPDAIPSWQQGPYESSVRNARVFMRDVLRKLLSPSVTDCPKRPRECVENEYGVFIPPNDRARRCPECTGTGQVTRPSIAVLRGDHDVAVEALREIASSTVPGDFKASGEWEIYQELARIRGDIARRALYRIASEEATR